MTILSRRYRGYQARITSAKIRLRNPKQNIRSSQSKWQPHKSLDEQLQHAGNEATCIFNEPDAGTHLKMQEYVDEV